MNSSQNDCLTPNNAEEVIDLVIKLPVKEQRKLSKFFSSWQTLDQRHHRRTSCSIITEFTAENRRYKGVMKNLSLDGAFVQSRRIFPINMIISQSFFFPNFEIPIHSKSRIAWCGAGGFGVQFEKVDHRE